MQNCSKLVVLLFVIWFLLFFISFRKTHITLYDASVESHDQEKSSLPIHLSWEIGTRRYRRGKTMRIVVLSDSHNRHDRLIIPDGDVLIHCGDMSDFGKDEEILAFNEYLGTLPHLHKIVIFGNHEEGISRYNREEIQNKFITNAIYLEDQSIEIDGVKFYGTPWVPNMFELLMEKRRLVNYKPNGVENLVSYDDMFYFRNNNVLRNKWSQIPSDVDFLITHSPPRDVLDYNQVLKHGVGCPLLRERLQHLKFLAIHVFGHIHENFGTHVDNGTLFLNAAVSEKHQPFYFDFLY